MVDYPIQHDAADINSILDQAKKINDKLGVYCGYAPINFDFANSQILIPKGFVVFNMEYYPSTSYPNADTVPITNTTGGVQALWFDVATRTYIAAHYTAWDNYTSNINLVLIATYNVESKTVYGASGQYQINGKYPKDINYKSDVGVYCGYAPINFDFANSQILIPKGWVVKDTVYNSSTSYPNADTVPITNTNSGPSALWFDVATRTYIAAHYTAWSTYTDTDKYVLIATFDVSHKTVYGPSGQYLINGDFQSALNYKDKLGVYCGYAPINFDFANSQILIPKGWVVFNMKYYSSTSYPNADTVPITNTTGGVQALWFDVATRTYIAAHYTAWSTYTDTDKYILIATYDATYKTVYGASGAFLVNGARPPQYDVVYDADTFRLILPDKIYFLTGESLPIYKSSIVAAVSDLDCFKLAVVAQAPGQSPKYNYFYEDIDLDPSKLPDSFEIGVKQSDIPTKNYYKNITSVVTDPSTKTSSTPKILCIGDSLTYRSMPALLKTKMSSLGITATMLGTYTSEGGEKAEGRGGWEFQNFIGSDNLTYTTVITRSESGSSTTLYQNPFLKLATPDDLISHPTWCFRNTGVTNELSYETDPDKTGNFYIFDFAWYLSAHGITTPDIVTIALSTNDISQETADVSIANCRLGLEIMVKQIHDACPDAKIGIVPSPAWGDYTNGNNAWNHEAATWVENCITDVNALNIEGVSIVPVWCHMDRTWNWPYSSTAALSEINSEVVATRSEYIHFGDPGKYQYVDALTAYIVSAL